MKKKHVFLALAIFGFFDFITAKIFGLPDEGIIVAALMAIFLPLGVVAKLVAAVWPFSAGLAWYYWKNEDAGNKVLIIIASIIGGLILLGALSYMFRPV